MKRFLDGVISGLGSVFDLRSLGESVATFLSRVIAGVLTFAAFYLVWWVVNRAVMATLHRSRVDLTTTSFVLTATKFLVLALGVVQALAAAGINTAAVVASLGIAGLTIGFAARDALSNLISGVLIFWDRPFVIGDLVEVGGQYGRVEKITLRSTRVVTPDGRMLAVPNSNIINQTVSSYTNFPHLRLDLDVGIGLQEPFDKVRKILLDLVRRDPAFMADPAPVVVVTQLGSYSNTVQLRVWLDDERRHVEKRMELREKMYEALSRAGVEMPVETLDLLPLRIQGQGAGTTPKPPVE